MSHSKTFSAFVFSQELSFYVAFTWQCKYAYYFYVCLYTVQLFAIQNTANLGELGHETVFVLQVSIQIYANIIRLHFTGISLPYLHITGTHFTFDGHIWVLVIA
jgi:hypothetical protein